LITGDRIKGLTTAAGLWTTACVGLATGMGYYYISVPMTLLMLLVTILLRPLTSKLMNRQSKEIIFRIVLQEGKGIKTINTSLSDVDCEVISITNESDDVYLVKLAKASEKTNNNVLCSLMENKSIIQVEKI
jgi:putative Mg2+ transporter-C (MgtC) family protein